MTKEEQAVRKAIRVLASHLSFHIRHGGHDRRIGGPTRQPRKTIEEQLNEILGKDDE